MWNSSRNLLAVAFTLLLAASVIDVVGTLIFLDWLQFELTKTNEKQLAVLTLFSKGLQVFGLLLGMISQFPCFIDSSYAKVSHVPGE